MTSFEALMRQAIGNEFSAEFFNNSEFTGDSIQALKLYLSYGLEFSINKKLGINMGFVPQLLLFKDTTERGLENNIMKPSLGIGYNLGFTYKF